MFKHCIVPLITLNHNLHNSLITLDGIFAKNPRGGVGKSSRKKKKKKKSSSLAFNSLEEGEERREKARRWLGRTGKNKNRPLLPFSLGPNDCRYCSSRNFLKSGVDEKSFAVKATKWVVHRAGSHCSPSFRLISRPLLYRPDIRIQKKKPLACGDRPLREFLFSDLPFFVEKVISYDSLTLLIDKEFRNNSGICVLLWMYRWGIVDFISNWNEFCSIII